MSKKNITITSVAAAIIIIVLLLPITLPMSIKVPCKISPAYTWVVEFGNDGNVLTTLHNSQSGSIESSFSAVPERGDSYEFKLLKDSDVNWVEKGDTIGLIQSNLLSQEYAALTGRLSTSRATLNVLMTGEKESLVKQAQQQLNAAIENAEYLNKIYANKKQLFEQNLISFEENELYRSQAKQAEIDIAAKRAYLESIQTGSKQEQINLVKNEIRAIEQELKVLNDKLESYVIVAPIKGNVNAYNSADTILTVNSPENILFIPVSWKYQSLLQDGLSIELHIADFESVNYSVIKVTNEIQQFNGEQVLTLIAKPDDENLILPANLWVSCNLKLGDVTLLEFIKWKLSQTYEV